MPTVRSHYAALFQRLSLKQAYFELREKIPTIPAHKVWAYVRSAEPCTLEQYVCQHDWSSGYDDSDHEIAIYCYNCGLCGDI